MKRIAIIGSGGSGKSTLALGLSAQLGIPVCHLDQLYWRRGWVFATDLETRPKLEAVMQEESWIIDGNYGSSLEERIKWADTVIFLDLPVWVCLISVVRRYFTYRGTHRPDMNEGNNERLTRDFIGWILSYRRTRRPRVLALLKANRHDTSVIILRSRREAREFVKSLSAAESGPG